MIKIPWPSNLRRLTFLHHNVTISESVIREKLAKKGKKVKDMSHSIQVERFNIKWLFQDDKHFQDFVKILTELTSTNLVFDTEFVSNLIEQFWGEI